MSGRSRGVSIHGAAAVISLEPLFPERPPLASDQRRGKLRVAIGLFGDRADAADTARDLEAGGTATARIGFAAMPVLIDSARRSNRSGNGYSWLNYVADETNASGTFVVVAPRPSDASAAEFAIIGDALNDHLHQRSLRRQDRQLHDHLVGGGWLLLVRLVEASEQHTVCSTLLRRARFGVQSHELRRV